MAAPEGRRGRGRGRGQDGEPLALPVRFSKLNKHYLSVQANKLALALGLQGTYFNKMRFMLARLIVFCLIHDLY